MKYPLTKAVSCIAIMWAVTFSAQRASAQFSYGIRAGVNLATINNESGDGYTNKPYARPYAGIFGQYNLSDPFALKLEVNYSGEGVYDKETSSDMSYKLAENFIRIPLLAQYKFSFGGFIEAGPQIGFLLSAKEKDAGETSVDVKDNFKSTDVGLGLGIGYEVSHGTLSGLGFSVRYMRGLTNIAKSGSDDDETSTNTKYTNRAISFGLSYRITTSIRKKVPITIV